MKRALHERINKRLAERLKEIAPGPLVPHAWSVCQLVAGDHVIAVRDGYDHHGIYVGDGRVIHFSGEPGAEKTEARIVECELSRFKAESQLSICDYQRKFDRDEVVSRARERLGEGGYNLLINNCEHFCYWCTTGTPRSEQVRRIPLDLAESVGGALKVTGVMDELTARVDPRSPSAPLHSPLARMERSDSIVSTIAVGVAAGLIVAALNLAQRAWRVWRSTRERG